MPTPTNQQIFDRVWDYFVVQKHPQAAIEREHRVPQCAYRTPSGLKCAVGCLIPDKLYNPAMECRSPGWIAGEFPETIPHIGLNFDLLEHLQTIHDYYFDEFESKMRLLADRHSFTIPSIS